MSGCIHGDGIVICAPRTFNHRRFRHCPTCGCKRLFLCSPAVWYSATWTCLTCGDSWCDGERQTRPFARGWRKKAVARAKRKPYTSKAEAMAGLLAEMEVAG